MKKTLLLSVVASTMIMAGGDIAPVEPVVETPAPVATGWDFSGQGVVYYQTRDSQANDLFKQKASRANVGLQFRAVNKDLIGGLGMGLELSGLGTLGLEKDVVSGVMQTGDDSLNSAAFTQAYLTYGFGNTSIKLGRQQLPKALSPFAFSEGWNVFKNTFGAALVVNTDITDTTLVYAWVKDANMNGVHGLVGGVGTGHVVNLGDFNQLNGSDGVHMLTAQNKSVENLTLTGSYYYAPNMIGADDLHILWADAKYNAGSFNVALQGGTVKSDALNDTVAFGAKAGGNFGMFDASVAYSHVDDGDAGVFNVGGLKTPLYTQMILNQCAIKSDNDTVVVRAGTKALGGKIGLAYGYTKNNVTDGKDYKELDLTYKTKVFNDSTTVFAGYVYTQQDGVNGDDAQNLIRVWGRYNF